MSDKITREAQDAIRQLCMRESGHPDLDGTVCDSDELEVTLTEVTCAFGFLKESMQAENTRLRECLRRALPALRMAYKGGHKLTDSDAQLYRLARELVEAHPLEGS